MHAEAPYWALITERHPLVGVGLPLQEGDRWLAALLEEWLGLGNRSLRDLFALHPATLAAVLRRPVDELAPLLALRARLPRVERLLDTLSRAGVDLLPAWERRTPRVLRDALAGLPPAWWYAGNLALLGRQPVAFVGARDSEGEILSFTRTAAAAVSGEGRAVLGGFSRVVERAALERALAEDDGTAIAVLGQGIGRALADLQRMHGALHAGRLLVLAALHPDAFWQPHLEALRAAQVLAVAERTVVARVGEDADIVHLAHQARAGGHALVQCVPAAEGDQTPLLEGAWALPWPAPHHETLVAGLLQPANRRARPARPPAAPQDDAQEVAPPPATAAGARPVRRAARAQVQAGGERASGATQQGAAPSAVAVPPTAGASSPILQDAVLHFLRRRKSPTGKGTLLQVLRASEAELDRVLGALIAAGAVVEHTRRTGVGYVAVAGQPEPPEGGFQLSLFGQG